MKIDFHVSIFCEEQTDWSTVSPGRLAWPIHPEKRSPELKGGAVVLWIGAAAGGRTVTLQQLAKHPKVQYQSPTLTNQGIACFKNL